MNKKKKEYPKAWGIISSSKPKKEKWWYKHIRRIIRGGRFVTGGTIAISILILLMLYGISTAEFLINSYFNFVFSSYLSILINFIISFIIASYIMGLILSE